MITTDLQFHRAFVAAAGNSRLLHMWERLVGELRLALVLVPREFTMPTLCTAHIDRSSRRFELATVPRHRR